MNKDFQDSFMGGDNSHEAEEQLNSNFGNSNLDDTFDGGDFSNSFESRFSNDGLDDSFEGGSDDFNDPPKGESKFGIAKGIIGALIATKLFSMIDKNGSISRLLGIENAMGPQGQQVPQDGAQGGQNAGNLQGVGQKISSQGGLLSGLLSIVMILIGVGIILVFTFYVLSFFFHDNLGPNKDITGAESSSDLSPWVERLTGKRNRELKIMPSVNSTEIMPYRYDKKEEMLYIYLEDNISTLPFGKDEIKRYKMDGIEDSGYMKVVYTKNSLGEVINVDPISLYDGKSNDSEDKEDKYIKEDELKGLGLTKMEYRRIKELMAQGMSSGWFRKKSDKKPELNNIDNLTDRINNDNKETSFDSQYAPQQSNVGGSGYVPQQAESSGAGYVPQQSGSGSGGGSQLQRFAGDEIIVKPAGEGGLDPEETEKARQEALNRSSEDELARLNAQYDEERRQEKIDAEKQKRLQELTDKGDQEYKDRLIREKIERQRREELENLENENKTTDKNKKNTKEKIIVKEAGKDKVTNKKEIIPAEPDRTGTDRLRPKYK